MVPAGLCRTLNISFWPENARCLEKTQKTGSVHETFHGIAILKKEDVVPAYFEELLIMD